MQLKKLLLLALLSASLSAHAGGSGSVGCDNFFGGYVTLSINYSTDSDAGQPGAIWIAMEDPGQPGYPQAFLTPAGWQPFYGGLYPAYGLYQGGLPGSVSANWNAGSDPMVWSWLPGGGLADPRSTAQIAGWRVWAGHGVLTPQAAQIVQDRRAALEAARPKRIAAGTWNPKYDDPAGDDEFRYALMIKDMQNNGKLVSVVPAVPLVQCYDPNAG